MKPEALQREHLTALITATPAEAERIRRGFDPTSRRTAALYLRAAVATCLEFRFGPGAGLGAGPVCADELAAFMSELRRTGRDTEPPPDYLAIESAVRALYGEPHLAEPLSDSERSRAHYTLLRKQIDAHPWLATNHDHLLNRAKDTAIIWLTG